MKNELKQLYKKDQKLALEVAKVLGYRIKVKADDMDVVNDVKNLIKGYLALVDAMEKHDNIIKTNIKHFSNAVEVGNAWKNMKKAKDNLMNAFSDYKKIL